MHGVTLRLDGQTFPFALHLADRPALSVTFKCLATLFEGLSASMVWGLMPGAQSTPHFSSQVLTDQTPWNAFDSGDVLWASEAPWAFASQES